MPGVRTLLTVEFLSERIVPDGTPTPTDPPAAVTQVQVTDVQQAQALLAQIAAKAQLLQLQQLSQQQGAIDFLDGPPKPIIPEPNGTGVA